MEAVYLPNRRLLIFRNSAGKIMKVYSGPIATKKLTEGIRQFMLN
jgi:hypothetical protein